MIVQITEGTDIRLIFNARPPDHTPTAISDTRVSRFHIAILTKMGDNEDHELLGGV